MTGSCHCGSIQYEFSGEPFTCYACHCTDCQTQSGSAFSMSMIVPLPSLKVRTGECAKYRQSKNESYVEHYYCEACGTRLWGVGSTAPGLAFLKPGTLNDTSEVQHVAHFWTKSAQLWVQFDSDTILYETQPEDVGELIRLWNERR